MRASIGDHLLHSRDNRPLNPNRWVCGRFKQPEVRTREAACHTLCRIRSKSTSHNNLQDMNAAAASQTARIKRKQSVSQTMLQHSWQSSEACTCALCSPQALRRIMLVGIVTNANLATSRLGVCGCAQIFLKGKFRRAS
jgi:hypothetical protein